MAEVFVVLTDLIVVFLVAAVVRIFATRVTALPYPVVLVVVGVGASVAGFEFHLSLSREVIFAVLLPTILFQSALDIDIAGLRADLPTIAALVLVGLPATVLLLGWTSAAVMGLPLIVALLFAATISPVDPVAVLWVFRDAGAPERLSTLAESESHLHDGFAVVVFSTLLAFLQTRAPTAESLEGIVTPARLVDLAVDITVTSFGGIVVGLAVGYVVYRALRVIDERMAELLLLVSLPYAAFLVADHLLHVSGVLATVAAGLVVGTLGTDRGVEPENVQFESEFWAASSFLVTTLLFLLVGVRVPARLILANAGSVAVAAVLVFVVRAAAIYPLLAITSQLSPTPVSSSYQHVLVWGAMHTVIPVALLLSLPASIPYRTELGALVYGVAIVSIVGQGLLLPHMVRLFDIAQPSTDGPDVR